MPIKNLRKRGRPRLGENNRVLYTRTSMTMPKDVFDTLEELRKPPKEIETVPRSEFYARIFQRYIEEVVKV